MAESSAPTVRAFHLVMRDAEEGGIHYAYEIEPYFSLPTGVVESLGVSVNDFTQSLISRTHRDALSSGSEEVGMDPWFEVEELPSGSTVPQLIGSVDDLAAYMLKGYQHACCIGWE